MRILEYGNINKPVIMFIHGFESPYQVFDDYIKYYQEKYYILVPVLPGHDVKEKLEFISFDALTKEIENYCCQKSITHIHAVYGMSMGGILAALLWQNQKITFDKVIMESSPLLPQGKYMAKILTKQYLSITKKAKNRDSKVIQKAINSMITEDKIDIFLELLDNISNETIKKYLAEVGKFQLSKDIITPDTQIIYIYGGKINEIIFKKVAKFIKQYYSNSLIICLKGKGHLEDALLHAKTRIIQLDKIIN